MGFSKFKTLRLWLFSLIRWLFVISIFIFSVFVYDKRIIYQFGRATGWLPPLHTNPGSDEFTDVPIVHDLSNSRPNTFKPGSQNGDIYSDTDRSDLQTHGEKNNLQDKMDSKKALTDVFAERNDAESSNDEFKYHVLQMLTNVHKKPHLKTRFDDCIRSILSQSSINLHFFFVVDEPSKDYIMENLQTITNEGIPKSQFQFTFLEIDTLGKDLAPFVSSLQEKLSGNHPYYTDTIFYLSLGIHRGVLPEFVHRVVMLDTDLKFMSDIALLFRLFDDFSEENVIGIAHEQQPVYRHLFSAYRSKNRGTRVGDPPPEGLAGFNSGVMLLDFDRMLSNKRFDESLNVQVITTLSDKYHFKGHLGDQDFFTLLNMEMSDLFYVLPCSWNKQLCIWWKDKGYANVFDLYFHCPDPIHVYHGNCNTPIPY